MLGLMILLALGVYLGLSAMVVWQAARWARRHNRSAWVWGGLAAFVLYNLVFWGWIPTVVMHKYYCATEAGFWVYKTPEQWVRENPGILEKLTAYNDGRSQELGPAHISYPLNQRISWQHKVAPVFVGIGKFEEILIDEKNGEVLAKEIYFRSGRCSGAPNRLADFKFWVARCKCNNEPFRINDGLSFSQYRDMVRGNPDKLHLGADKTVTIQPLDNISQNGSWLPIRPAPPPRTSSPRPEDEQRLREDNDHTAGLASIEYFSGLAGDDRPNGARDDVMWKEMA